MIDIVYAHTTEDKRSVEALAHDFDLPDGHVYAALAYYYQNQAEMDAGIERDRAESDRLLRELEAKGRLSHLD
ncbi:MAG: hypothetical protein SF162_11930 [bacterium]|nr:hypothetical protein [bacterium]